MTTLTFHISRCLGRRLKAGDEIVLSRMDHDANVAPWLLLAEEKALTVRFMDFDTETYEFDDDALDRVLSERTKLVAVGHASNLTGTVNDVKAMAAKAAAAGALVYVDAVQFGAAPAHRRRRRSAAISWSPRPTSGSGRTRASCGEARRLSRRRSPTRCGRPETIWDRSSRPAP